MNYSIYQFGSTIYIKLLVATTVLYVCVNITFFVKLYNWLQTVWCSSECMLLCMHMHNLVRATISVRQGLYGVKHDSIIIWIKKLCQNGLYWCRSISKTTSSQNPFLTAAVNPAIKDNFVVNGKTYSTYSQYTR